MAQYSWWYIHRFEYWIKVGEGFLVWITFSSIEWWDWNRKISIRGIRSPCGIFFFIFFLLPLSFSPLFKCHFFSTSFHSSSIFFISAVENMYIHWIERRKDIFLWENFSQNVDSLALSLCSVDTRWCLHSNHTRLNGIVYFISLSTSFSFFSWKHAKFNISIWNNFERDEWYYTFQLMRSSHFTL